MLRRGGAIVAARSTALARCAEGDVSRRGRADGPASMHALAAAHDVVA